jgi:hypothetical protein
MTSWMAVSYAPVLCPVQGELRCGSAAVNLPPADKRSCVFSKLQRTSEKEERVKKPLGFNRAKLHI